MKVAIAYDWLNVKHGGGEDTLIEVTKLYPKADIFCLVYNRKKFDKYFGNRNITTSSLQHFPGFIKKRPYLLLPFIKRAVTKLDFTGYDLVISVSSAWVKNVKIPEYSKHISYCFSPARMIWDSWPRYIDSKITNLPLLKPLVKFYVTHLVSKLRLWDYYSSSQVDQFISISEHVSRRIKKFYGLESKVIYPPVNIKAPVKTNNTKPYYVIVSVLAEYKNIELAIEAFKINKQHLIVAGSGPDEDRLKFLAGNHQNIEFVGRVSEKDKYQLLSGAQAFVFTSIEDFGIAPVESMSQGTPVIALRGGGLDETVTDGVSGVFYDEASADSLNSAIRELKKMQLSKKRIIKSVEKFKKESFSINLKREIEKDIRK